MRRTILTTATAVLLLSAASPALAGRGGSNELIRDAITSGSRDAIIAEIERAEVLACMSCGDAIVPLVDHPDARVREVAAWWLGRRGQLRAQVRDAAYARLQGTDAVLARNAAEALGAFRHVEAVPALAAYLAKPLDAESGVAAAAALGKIGHASALPALEGALSSRFAPVRAAAASSLREFPGRQFSASLTPLLGDGDAEVRSQAVYTLGASRDRSAMSPLMAVVLQDSSPDVRKHAAWALGEIGNLDAVPVLIEAKNDADPLVRSMAKAALARLR